MLLGEYEAVDSFHQFSVFVRGNYASSILNRTKLKRTKVQVEEVSNSLTRLFTNELS